MRAAKLTVGVLTIASLTALPAQAAGPKGPSPKSHGPTVNSRTHGGGSKTRTTSATPRVVTASTSITVTPTGTRPLNPIARKIASKPNLSSRVGEMLPAGMSLNQASKGFKNQGQFIAALHVSQNLGIPFADLKTAMTGIRPVSGMPGSTPPSHTSTTPTTTETLSLGQAIKKLRPGTNATTAAAGAERQAATDLRIDVTSTTSTTRTTATTATATTTTTTPAATTTTAPTRTSKRTSGK